MVSLHMMMAPHSDADHVVPGAISFKNCKPCSWSLAICPRKFNYNMHSKWGVGGGGWTHDIQSTTARLARVRKREREIETKEDSTTTTTCIDKKTCRASTPEINIIYSIHNTTRGLIV